MEQLSKKNITNFRHRTYVGETSDAFLSIKNDFRSFCLYLYTKIKLKKFSFRL